MTSKQLNTHMPIGLHVAVGGNMTGAGQPDGYWVQVAKAGRKPVVKSVNNYGPILEALEYCDANNVEGVFVYRIAKIANDGFNFDVPSWSMPPTKAAAYHVARTIAELPPEFDKRVWLEIINEPDKDEDETKPTWTTKEFAQWLNAFGFAAAKELLLLGFKISMFGFSSGEPELPDWKEYIPFFELVDRHHDRLAIALHEYAYSDDLTNPQTPNPYLLGRFVFMLELFDKLNLHRPKIHITEFGWTLWHVAETDAARLQFLDVLLNIYGDYPEVEMLALWYFGPKYDNIANDAVKLIPLITELALTWSHEMQTPLPPPIQPPLPEPPPPQKGFDLASFFMPNDAKEYGPVYTLANNWDEGPERTQIQLKNHMNNNIRRFSYITKNDNWERRYIGDQFIYLQVDTSRSAEEWYKVSGPWLPRHMLPGQIFHRKEFVTIYSKDTCKILNSYVFDSSIRFDGLIWEPSPNEGQRLYCAKFTWLVGHNSEPEESYWYAQGIGLVRWYRHRDAAESRITEFVPPNEHNNPVNFACPEMKEWISELPTEPPPIKPPTEPPPTAILPYLDEWMILHDENDYRVNEGHIKFHMRYHNPTDQEIIYGGLGAMIYSYDEQTGLLNRHYYQHSYKGQFQPGYGPGTDEGWKDQWKPLQTGTFAIYPFLTFDPEADNKRTTPEQITDDHLMVPIPFWFTIGSLIEPGGPITPPQRPIIVPPPPEPPTEPPSEYLAYPRGIDISHWQKEFNPEKAMEEGANFAYCKATQGTSHIDDRYLEYTKQANDYGMLTGSYHFFDPRLDGALQAAHFIEVVEQTDEQHLPPALDLETLAGADIPDHNAYRKQVLAFLQVCEDKLITPIIYTNKSWYDQYLSTPDFDKYDLWIASWTNGTLPYLPIRNEDWLFWQFGVREGSNYGVESNTVDVNYTDFDSIEEFYNVFSNNWREETPPPLPTPTYFPAPRRVNYPRTCLVIYDGMTDSQKNSVWELAKSLKQTIMFSYDDAGSTPVTENTAILYGIPAALHDKYIQWFNLHYPETTVIFKGGSFYERQPGQQNIATEVTKGEANIMARLRRALVRLSTTDN